MRPAQNERPSLPPIIRFIATGMYAGYSPIAPGTAGSLLGLALFFTLPGFGDPLIMAVWITAVFTVGTVAAARAERILGEDPPVVVIDEVVGMWITLYAFGVPSLWVSALGFFFFRLFDIIKPPPARRLERFSNGFGIMLDDVAAGLYGQIALRLLLVLIPSIG